MSTGKKPEIIDRNTARFLIRLFDRMYSLGVNDAAMAEDEGLVHEWVKNTSKPGIFGRLGDRTSNTPLYWSITLRRVAYDMNAIRQFSLYERRAGRYGSNYLSVAWRVAQSFYNLGMTDYVENPGAWELAIFNSQTRVRWVTKGRNWRIDAMVSQAQEFCFLNLAIDRDTGGKLAMPERRYNIFITAIALAARRPTD